jgi:hypothetical protein
MLLKTEGRVDAGTSIAGTVHPSRRYGVVLSIQQERYEP